MIDLHSHLLPGVDDGARTSDVSAAVLRRFALDGVRLVVCTPHLRASRAHRAPAETCADRLESLRAVAPEGLADVLASDNHGDARALAPARRWLAEQGAGEQATLLTETNPERLLRNEPVLPVPPAPVRDGALARLRDVLGALPLAALGRARRAD